MSVSSLNWGSGGIVGAINELMDNVTGESQITHSALGLISFSDVDIDRYHSITVTGPDGAIGGFTAMVADPATGDGSGTVLWQYSVPDAATEHLGEGETVTEVFTMHLTDDQGEEVTQDVTVTVTGKNDAPEIIAHSPDVTITALADGSEGEGEATHTATGSVEFDDLDLTDSHTLTVFSPYGHRGELVANIVQSATGDGTGVIEWSYVVSDGSLDDLSSGDTFIENFLLQIDDGHGGVVLTSVNVTLSAPENAAPVISADISAALSEDDAPTIINLLANASDSDGDDLDVHNASISVSDGRPLAYSLSSETGGLAFDPGQFNYLTEGESVTITVSYNVTDGSATVPASAVIVIEGRNDGPVAVQDVVLATEDTTTSPVTGNVLSNDTDVDGDALEVISVNGEAGYVGQQINGVYGLITIGANGSYSYVLDNARQAVQELAEGQVVSESFSYQIRDEHGETAIASVEVTVVGTNDSPVVAGVDLGEVDDDETRIITAAELLANSSDIDGDALSVVSVSIAAEAGSVYDNGDGTWTFVPQLGYVQDDVQIEFVVSDGTAETTGTASIDVLLGNEAPVAGDDTVDVSANAPTVISAEDLLANDQDVDGDALEIVSVEAGAHGTVALDEDGNVVFTPEDGYTGDASFSYTVSDGQGGTDSATVQVSVTEVQDEGGNVTPNASEVWDTAQLSNGGQVVIWHNGEGLTGSNIYAGDGSVVKSHYRLPGDPTNLAELKVEGLANGGFVVAGLNSNNRVVFAVYNNEGLLSRSWQPVISESYPHGVPDIIATQGGGFTLVMHGNRGTSTRWDTLGRRYDANGNALGDVFEINAPINGDTHANGIELADGRLMLFSVHRLPNNWQVTGQVFSAEGSALGEAFDVASSTSGIDDFVVAPIRLNDGRIALTVGGELHIYSVDGTNSVVEDVTVSFGELGGSAISDLVALADDGVFVLYTREEGDEYQVFGQRYDASGNLVGDEVVFGELSVGSETMARLEPSTDGGADVVYLSNGTHLTRIHVEPEVTGETVDRAQFRDEQHAPVAADDAVEVTADLTTVISASDLLSNDQDADGDTLEIVSVEAGEHGAVSLDENGNVVFTPEDGYTGDASFSYTVSDGQGGTDSATVQVSVTEVQDEGGNVTPNASEVWDTAQLSNGGQVVIWHNGEGLTGSNIYAGDGSVVKSHYRLPGDPTNLAELKVEGLANGGFVVAGLNSNNRVVFAVYNNEGLLSRSWQPVISESYPHGVPDIIATQGGGFTLVMHGNRGTSTRWDTLGRRYDANGNALGDVFEINAPINGDTHANGIELADGRLMLFSVHRLPNNWQVTGQVFSAEGSALGEAFDVASSTSGIDDFVVAPIRLNDGRIALTVGGELHIYSVDGTNSVVEDVTVSFGELGGSAISDLVALADDGVFVLYTREEGDEYQVFGQRYDASGNLVGDEVVFGELSVGSETMARLEPSTDGGADVVYLSNGTHLTRIHVEPEVTGETVDRAQFRDEQHAPVAADDAVEVTADLTTVISASDLLSNDQDADGDTLEIVSVEAGEHGAVSLDENGNVVFTPNAGYTGGASFSYTVSDGAGGLDRATVIVDVVPLEINSTAVDTTIDLWDVAQLANGNEVSVWRSSGDEGIYATIYRADGSYEREAALLSETTRVLTQLHVEGLADGGFVVAGRTNDIVTFSIYDASGNMTSDWQTATGEDPAQIYSEYSQRDPEIIALRGGGFLLTLSDKRPENLIDYDILVKRYDADGNAMGDGFKISSSSHDYQSNGIELPDGRLMLFVVSALNEWSVTAQIFSLAGEALGDAETVWQEPVGNSSVENYDATPILLVDGRVALIVRNQFHVYSVDADNAITLDFSIDINTGDVGPRDFLVSDMVALEDGGIFAVMIRKDGAEYEVYGQRYDANGEPISEELVFDRFSGEMSVRLEPAEDGGAYVTYLNADGSASSLNRIHVNSSLTGDTATRGQYRNDTPIGNDMMSGDDSADTFIFGNGGDADVILDADNSDHIEMTSGVDAEDVWFLQNGEDLVIQLLGHQDNLTVSDWFDGTGNHLVNYIELGSGASLDGANVQALVDAMSVFGVGDVIADTIDRNSEAFSNVQTVIAANWQN